MGGLSDNNRLVSQIYLQAKALGACELLTGREAEVGKLIDVLMSAEGLDWAVKKHYPSIGVLQQIDSDLLVSRGIYFNAGVVELHNPTNVLLVGDTHGLISYDRVALHCVTCMHGASVVLSSSEMTSLKLRHTSDCRVVLRLHPNSSVS